MGQRTDPSYLRVYDKGVESGKAPAGELWRLEAEFKYDLAPMIWTDLVQHRAAPEWCWSTCASQWRSSGCGWPFASAGAQLAAVRAPAKPESPAVKLAAWLRQSVAPTIPRVLEAYSVQDVLELLGMDHLAKATEPDDTR